MFNSPELRVVARVWHRCTWCGERIEPGDEYIKWSSFDDSVFRSKVHSECMDLLQIECNENGGEYTPYENTRPLK